MDFINIIEKHQETVEVLRSNCLSDIEKISDMCRNTIRSGNKILFCGNGGSAADSQHLAAEFVGRFLKERRGISAIALTTDTSILTAIGNDYGYEEVFRRQVEALGNPGDVLVGISTSGNSVNVVRAFEEARKHDMKLIAFTGQKRSKMSEMADATLKVPSVITARIQECHILVGHMVCQYIDEDFK